MMGVVLSTKSSCIRARDMKDGQIAVVIGHGDQQCIGRVIQGFGDRLITIGMPSGNCWGSKTSLSDEFRVRILDEGESLVINGNT